MRIDRREADIPVCRAGTQNPRGQTGMSASHPRLPSSLTLALTLFLFSPLTHTPAAAPEPGLADAKAHPFPLAAVRLLDSPFKDAQDRDAKYLLDLDPDRLLHNFRVNARLPSAAEPLGGWEAPKCELHGHFVGHYLSACSLMYASTGDARFKDRANQIVAAFAECQKALGPSGYLSAFPETFFDRVENGERVWTTYYTLHKIHAGLLDSYEHCGNTQALDVARRLGDWAKARTDRLDDARMETMLRVEHGGMIDCLANLYDATGDPRHLATAKRFYHHAVLDPLARGEDRLAGLHANTQFPKIIGLARLYELTGEPTYRRTAEFFWDRVVNHHSYALGGNSDHEHFGPPGTLSERVSPTTAESCNTYNMLKLTRHLFAWDASPARAEYYERALYNHILATQDPDTGMMAYHIPVHGGWFLPYNTPNDSFWCCTGTGVENHAKYGDSIYWRAPDALFVNLFIPSILTWKEKGITLAQRTRFPDAETSTFDWTCEKPVTMELLLRCPAWLASPATVSVNGEPINHGGTPGAYAAIRREWKTGDRVEIRLPMSPRLEPMPDNPCRAAIFHGPILLAGELGTEGIAPPMPYAKSQKDFFSRPPPPQPVLVTGDRPPSDWLAPVATRPLTYTTRGVGRPRDITLTPFYRLHHQRYSLYWDLMTEADWEKQKADIAAAQRRERDLTARAIDCIPIGTFEVERNHNLQGERTSIGHFRGRAWRHATDGGWFSYELKVPAGGPAELHCTFWGSDKGKRTFDILADGYNLATVDLEESHPGQFFDVAYPIPAETTAGKKKITIRFQAHPGNLAGGVFDVRMLKAHAQ